MQVPESSPASHQQRQSSKEFISHFRQAPQSVSTRRQEERWRLSMGDVAHLDGPKSHGAYHFETTDMDTLPPPIHWTG